jgi:phosphatidylserine/phosphatidylglycerophosphate/cardiolipin synthase-like enzyme
MFRLKKFHDSNLKSSKLYDQTTFYNEFMKDLAKCSSEIIIESPFITTKRMSSILPLLHKAIKKGVRVTVNTRSPEEHENKYYFQARQAVNELQTIGALVLFTGGHHRKIAVLDQSVIWEGSLNILSHNDSCEIMRRISSPSLSKDMISFIGIRKYSKIG